jgi:hypothetical protein
MRQACHIPPEATPDTAATVQGTATAEAGPRGWDALTHLSFSRYLRLDPAHVAGFVRAVTALLDAGADANTGFYDCATAHPSLCCFERNSLIGVK